MIYLCLDPLYFRRTGSHGLESINGKEQEMAEALDLSKLEGVFESTGARKEP